MVVDWVVVVVEEDVVVDVDDDVVVEDEEVVEAVVGNNLGLTEPNWVCLAWPQDCQKKNSEYY